jgi:hypothetical protein
VSIATDVLVAEIRSLYGRRHEEKLQIQRDMVVLRDAHGWTQRRIADATGVPQSTVDLWLRAYDESLTKVGQASRLTPESVQLRSDRRVAERVIATAPVEDRVEMAAKLLEDKDVARETFKTVIANPSYSRAAFDRAAYERNAEKRRKDRERAEQRAIDGAMPLPAYIAKMVEKIGEWSLALAALVDDIGELPEGPGRDLLLRVVTEHDRQVHQWLDVLEVSRRPELTVIEGKASVVA